MYSLIDPHWGENLIMPAFIRETEEEVWKLAETSPLLRLYNNSTDDMSEDDRARSRANLKRSGFTVKRVRVTIEDDQPA